MYRNFKFQFLIKRNVYLKFEIVVVISEPDDFVGTSTRSGGTDYQ